MNYMFFFILWFWFIMLIFCILKHPLIMGLMLIIMTFFLCMFTMMYSLTSWNSYILFLMFLGGILILFLYNISLISTEIFSMKINLFYFSLLLMLLLFNFKESKSTNMVMFSYKKEMPMMLLMFTKFNYNMLMLLVLYLFFTLICIVNLIYLNKNKGSMNMM